MRLSDFDFDLPEDRIALRPASPRDRARLLVVRPGGGLEDRGVADLPSLLAPGDVLVFNDTRVIPARLFGARMRDGSAVRVEATLHKRLSPERWSAFMRPGKRLKPGDRVRFGEGDSNACLLSGLDATVEAKGDGGEVTLAFDLAGPALDDAIRNLGLMPLPPYIASKRAEDERDRTDYQTVYAREDGSVAAPTAGLHFTPDLLARLDARGIARAFVTLHVGAGTFLPVKTDRIDDHKMHAEVGVITEETASFINDARARGGRVVAVGTTSLRLLESAAGEDGVLRPFAGETDIFIRPGHRFRIVDALMSNFHLPQSTLLMLVAALAGVETMRGAYAHAVAAGYRFYSYGDSSLWFRR
ncbi:MAG TPA: tRNA preQ1(34) S-adenosylmethionine ribosyltransferase-isomerase QueA [Caulobacteraceae bacterium]|jgi:S-adenosylmethionine:tRNA ribosyltransferase-isomerase|nr:tRNA preQ1(34) S-adenosylmethionine ribosyltransferase-isomerase QueA [Caulobacteraceae bacterium]